MIQVPGYLIKREIGKGGMATVYLAVQASLDREVALKVMQPTLANDPNFSRRFMQEARTLASLSHPHIVAVYDVGVTEAQLHYFSMQHLPGGDFSHKIRDGVGETEVVRVLAGVARALGFAHQRGFVHRDVSPANILYDASGHPVLTDFGIARAVARTSRLTNAGVSVGTSQYMSPEQARAADVDARSDIYSLGCVAFEALAGKPPYSGDDGFAIAYAHVFEPIPRLPESLAHWQPLIDRSLAKNPAERYANLDEFLEALARVGAAPLPIEPGPEPEAFDDSDFMPLGGAQRTQQIPAELLGVLPAMPAAAEPRAEEPQAEPVRRAAAR
ncbi:MAG TPA: serine/threonine-protein kinase, partial [Candidatus Saccharimonadia bacterium]|nr:serine/threonine-protein kinase [Candidatus Saccharimonadia bacterium]